MQYQNQIDSFIETVRRRYGENRAKRAAYTITDICSDLDAGYPVVNNVEQYILECEAAIISALDEA